METYSSYMQITKPSLHSSLWSSDHSHGEQLKKLTLATQFKLAVCDFKVPLVLFCVYSMQHTCHNNFLCQLAHKNIRISLLAAIFIYNMWPFNNRELKCARILFSLEITLYGLLNQLVQTQCSFQTIQNELKICMWIFCTKVHLQ